MLARHHQDDMKHFLGAGIPINLHLPYCYWVRIWLQLFTIEKKNLQNKNATVTELEGCCRSKDVIQGGPKKTAINRGEITP